MLWTQIISPELFWENVFPGHSWLLFCLCLTCLLPRGSPVRLCVWLSGVALRHVLGTGSTRGVACMQSTAASRARVASSALHDLSLVQPSYLFDDSFDIGSAVLVPCLVVTQVFFCDAPTSFLRWALCTSATEDKLLYQFFDFLFFLLCQGLNRHARCGAFSVWSMCCINLLIYPITQIKHHSFCTPVHTSPNAHGICRHHRTRSSRSSPPPGHRP